MVDTSKIKQQVSKKKSNNQTVKSGNSRVQPHLHCRVCYEVIPSGSEPRVCSEEACIDKNTKDEKNQKQLRIWMFIFLGIFAFSFIGPMIF